MWEVRKGMVPRSVAVNTQLYIVMLPSHLSASLCYFHISATSLSWGIHQSVELHLLRDQQKAWEGVWHTGTALMSPSTWAWRKHKLATSVSVLLDVDRSLHTRSPPPDSLVSAPAPLLSRETESLSHSWSVLATVFLRLFSRSAAFTIAPTYFRTTADYLITYSQRSIEKRWCMQRGPFFLICMEYIR